ncbi:dienelactone hydrolase family protein [Candidatus Poriferisocius sp.]|uniref:dienelactone hydrolase family protein n=1 Tax=Candidatus Poriferisocius sp. TaxID=3101276 RepID=UPI003B02C0F5
MQNVNTENVELTTADGPMRLYVARPDGEPQAAVIVIMEAFGLNGHIEEVTRRVAAEGYLAVAPDLYHRYETKVVGYEQMAEIMDLMGNLTDPQSLMDVDATLEYLGGQGFTSNKVGITGFCMGGRVTFLTAISRPVGAAVTYYGGAIVTEGFTPNQPKLADRHGDLRCPWLGLFGDLDGMIPIDGLEQLRADLETSTQPTDLVRYAEADHGFSCNERPSYNAEAAADGWSRMLTWFEAHLG